MRQLLTTAFLFFAAMAVAAKYAERYLQLSEIEQAEEETYRLIDCVVEQTAVRDTSKCFAVRFKGGKCETAEVHVSEDGILQAINAEPLKAPRYVPFTPSAKRSQPQSRRYLSAEILAAGSIASPMTRFIVAVSSVTQLIYLSEVGGLILGSKIPVNIGELFLLFLERTIIGLLIVCPIAHLIF